MIKKRLLSISKFIMESTAEFNKKNSIRLGGIDLLKHLFALFVVFQHMTSESRYSIETNIFIQDTVRYIESAVMGFFLISGFFFHSQITIKIWLKKNFKRIILPFLIFSLLYTLLLFVFGKGSLSGGIIKTVMLHGASMQLYYLPYLFVISFFYLLLSKWAKFLKIHFLIIVFLIILVSLIVSLFLPTDSVTGSDYKLLPIYFLCFGVGICFQSIRETKCKKLNLLVLLAIVFFCIIGFMLDTRCFHLSFIIALFLAAFNLSIKYKSIQRIFHGSGGIYLLHTPIVNFAISTLLVKIGVLDVLNLFISWGTTYLCCLVLTFMWIKLYPKRKWILLE